MRDALDAQGIELTYRDLEGGLAAADTVMFSGANEAWVTQIVASYGVEAPFACAAEIMAALKGDA